MGAGRGDGPFSGHFFPPKNSDGIGRLGQPFFVVSQHLQCIGGKILGAVSGGMPQWFQQAGIDEDGDFVRFKSEMPGGLVRTHARGRQGPV